MSGKLGFRLPAAFLAGAASDKRAAEMKVEIARIGREIVSGMQVARLNEVIDLLSVYGFSHLREREEPHYLVIDKLDQDWVDDSIRFKLIKALLQTVQTFKKIRGLKIIIAIRSDVFYKTYNTGIDATVQREKIFDYVTQIRWSRKQFEDLLDRRFEWLYKMKKVRGTFKFSDIFVHDIDKKDPLDFVVEHSLLRPRDVIEYVNECLRVAEGSEKVTASHIRQAERSYSASRRTAILDEWQLMYPCLWVYLDYISGKPGSFSLGDLCTEDQMGWLANLIIEAKIPEHDPIAKLAARAANSSEPASFFALGRSVLATLYRVGAIRLKLSPEDPWVSCANAEPDISSGALGLNTRVAIHPMLAAALGANRPSAVQEEVVA